MTHTEPVRPVCFAVPGFMGQPEDWDSISKAVSARLELRALALPYIPPGEGTSRSFLEWVCRWYGTLELPQHYTLLGYSLGGRLAMALSWVISRNGGPLPKALILENAHPGINVLNQRRFRWQSDQKWVHRLQSTDRQAALKEWYQQPVFSSLSEAQTEARIRSRIQTPPGVLAEQMQAFSLARQPDMSGVLAGLPFPVYFISGAKDSKFSDLSRTTDGLQRLSCPQAGHIVHSEQPDWFCGQLIHIHKQISME